MNKKDLETGMVVRLRTGTMLFVIGGKLCGINCWQSLINFDEDLSRIDSKKYDIIEIYIVSSWGNSDYSIEEILNPCNKNLSKIWTRDEKVTVTIDVNSKELSKLKTKFGKNIKILT